MDIDEEIRRKDALFKKLVEEAEKAKESGDLIGRYFSVGVADGNAFYRVKAVQGNYAYIEYVPISLDEYTLPIIEHGMWVPIDRVKAYVERTEKLRDIFGKKEQKPASP